MQPADASREGQPNFDVQLIFADPSILVGGFIKSGDEDGDKGAVPSADGHRAWAALPRISSRRRTRIH